MKKESKPEILYSDPVKEIMGRPPRKILQWGTSIIFLAFSLFVLLAWIIKYPDTIPANVEITTENPPVTLTGKVSGRIKNLYIKDKEIVSDGQLLAVIETSASIEEINRLKKMIDTINQSEFLRLTAIPDFSELGEMQSYWATFVRNISDYLSFIQNDFYGNKIISISEEISSIGHYIERLKVKEELFNENLILEVKKFKRDSILYLEKFLSESNLEISRQALIRINIELQQVRLDHSAKLIEIAEKNQLLQDYRIKQEEDKERLLSVLNESFLNLKAQVKIWENTYLLISPIGGTVTFTRFWHDNQSVIKDEPVLNIVPDNAGEYVGRINLKMQRSGKVKTGQMVNIKLTGYPYMEYGTIRGVIKSISLVPAFDTYIIEISLPSGLISLYGKNLEFTHNMQGVAEIITKDTRLLEKIINPFRYLVSRNRQ
jgi:multidrug efflux pump subunit AcrA (membrane-fusion protein)